MISIRKAVDSDIPYFYEICLKTGNNGKGATELFYDPYLLGQYYAAPYLFHNKELCFVLEKDNRPQGYIIATNDTTEFLRWRHNVWVTPLKERYPKPFPKSLVKSGKEEETLELLHKENTSIDYLQSTTWFVDYPAHLHINILPAMQRKGFGRIMMEELFKELDEREVNGIHLWTGIENHEAISFYEKMGFSILQQTDQDIILGKLI